MDLPATALALAAAVLVTVACGWRGAGPFDPRRGPRLLPWRLMMVTAAAVVLVLGVHLASLIGVHTDR